jgi:hypothetical protein
MFSNDVQQFKLRMLNTNPLFFFRTFEVIIYKHAEENVILVNEHDEQIGLPKLEAHQKLFCIALFSVFCLNSQNEINTTTTSTSKYHSPLCVIPVVVIKERRD